jgi:hypothetical protein
MKYLIVKCSECDATTAAWECIDVNMLDIYFTIENAIKYKKNSTFTDDVPKLSPCTCDKESPLDSLKLNAGDLKEALKDVHDSAKILYQRIEDSYFEENHWTTKKIEWEQGNICEYIEAFSAYSRKDEKGKDVFIINAHY